MLVQEAEETGGAKYPLVNGYKSVNGIQTTVTDGYKVAMACPSRVTANKTPNLRDVATYSNAVTCTDWFNLTAGQEVELRIKNKTGSIPNYTIRFYEANTTNIWWSAQDTGTADSVLTKTVKADVSIGCINFLNRVTINAGTSFSYELNLYVDGVLYFGEVVE